MTKAKLPGLVEITLADVEKLGLEQYTASVMKSTYLGDRLATIRDKERALSSARGEAEGATHYIVTAARLVNARECIVYAFIFYGPPKPKP